MAQNPYSAHLAQCIAIVKQQGYTLTVIRLVGSGTYSQVYTVTHSGYPNKNLCLKILETDHAEGPSGIEYRSQERAGQLLNGVADHVIVPRVYQDFNLGSWRGILMDYFPFEVCHFSPPQIVDSLCPIDALASRAAHFYEGLAFVRAR